MNEENVHNPAVVVLNSAYLEDLGADGTQRYVQAVVAVAEKLNGEAEVTEQVVVEHLTRAFDSASLPTTEVVVQRLAEKLRMHSGGQLMIQTDRGEVLHGPNVAPDELTHPEATTADPEHPDRPAYS